MQQHLLITGGCRSGKSRYALTRAETFARRCFMATATPVDEEMRQRIARHQADRSDAWTTIEEPMFLCDRLEEREGKDDVVLIDCVTLWVSNWLLAFDDPKNEACTEERFDDELNRLIGFLQQTSTPVILVTNEVGWGVVPDNPLGRRFRDLAGSVNQRLARATGEVVLMVSGIPMSIQSPRLA